MKNKEKFANEIAELACDGSPFAVENGIPVRCQHCERCDFYNAASSRNCYQARREWGEAEYAEVDWSKVAVNTLIFVRDFKDDKWFPRYFCKYEEGRIYAWDDGLTSWTTKQFCEWDEAKLQEVDPVDVDWANIPVDTPILVRDSANSSWNRRHFCKYEEGRIYAWDAGFTSRTVDSGYTSRSIKCWKQAKLAF